MKKTYASFLLFAVLLGCLFWSGNTGNFKTALGNNSNASMDNHPDWPMFQNDLAHSGYTASNGPVSNQTLWSYPTGPILSSPTVAGGIVYVGLNDGKVLALNAFNGVVLWKYQTDGGIHSSPAVADNVVYFGSWDNHIYALNALNGELLWRHKTGSYVQSSPAVANGVLYVASYDANVSALDVVTGKLLWSFRTGAGAVGSSPAVVNGVVYIGDNGGTVWALDASTGTAKWRFTAGDTVYSSPAVVDGVVYIGGDLVTDGTVYALDASTGAKLWSFSTGNLWVYSSPAVANGVVYVGSYDHLTSSNSGILYALDASTGKMIWSHPVGTEVMTSPIVANNIVYAGGNENNFYALNASTGAVLWSYQQNSPSTDSWTSAAIANGILYVGFGEGTLFAFVSSNAPATLTPTSSPTSTPVTTNATVPASTDNGKTVNLTISGNITKAQMSKITIKAHNVTTTGLFFTVSGENGTIGFSNITIPKSFVPFQTTPLIFIDGAQAPSQGYTQDTDNYYVYYTTQFSIHQIAIMFTSTTSSPTPIATNGQTNWLQIAYSVGVAMVVVAIITFGTYYVISVKRRS